MAGATAHTADGVAARTDSGARPAATDGTADGLVAARTINAGPPYNFTTELVGQFELIPLKDKSMLTRTKLGYLYRTGQQHNHIVVTRDERGLRFVDTGTKSFKKLSPACRRERVPVGIAAVCRVPDNISRRWPLLIEIWPRLGNDFADTSSLPATFAVTVLSDRGRDVARFGAGPDFFNGHTGTDRVRGGAGNDWIRAGHGNDFFRGGQGNDDLVAMPGHDTVRAGRGHDRVGGGDGRDRLWALPGTDMVLCGTGRDSANVETRDRVVRDCESIDRH
jgi:hypothetical protein